MSISILNSNFNILRGILGLALCLNLGISQAATPYAVYTSSAEWTSRPSLGSAYATKTYAMPITAYQPFSSIVITTEIYHGGWHSYTDPITGVRKSSHALFWFLRGTKWKANVAGYPTAKQGSPTKIKLGTNIDTFSASTPGKVVSDTAPIFKPNQWHKVRYVYDAAGKYLRITITNPAGKSITVTSSVSPDSYNQNTITNVYSKWYLYFGSAESPVGAPGPEASTEGWKIRNLRAEFYR